MVPGCNYQCYVGTSRPTEEALEMAGGKISAAYRLAEGGVFERWFPSRPDVSTLITVNSGDALLLLASDTCMWTQPAFEPRSTVNLVRGWNGVCYLGSGGPVEAAISGIDLPYTVIYSLGPDHTWHRFVPGRPEVSNLSQLAKFTPVLILVTGSNGHWVFNP
jgi:hypothetical protein